MAIDMSVISSDWLAAIHTERFHELEENNQNYNPRVFIIGALSLFFFFNNFLLHRVESAKSSKISTTLTELSKI
jgi:hypothetical protein